MEKQLVLIHPDELYFAQKDRINERDSSPLDKALAAAALAISYTYLRQAELRNVGLEEDTEGALSQELITSKYFDSRNEGPSTAEDGLTRQIENATSFVESSWKAYTAANQRGIADMLEAILFEETNYF